MENQPLFAEMGVSVLNVDNLSDFKVPEGATIINGDAARVLRFLPDELAHVIVTSPPYFGQRNYDAEYQIGDEPNPDIYIEKLVEVFRECKRVLRQDGTLWLNIGDKYMAGELLGMPWRVALALKSEGWLLRSDIIWHKPNAMPSSAKSRPTVDHEYLFLFSRSKKYYYDADAIREPHVTFTEKSRMYGGRNHFHKRGSTPEMGKNAGNPNLHNARWDQAFHPKGRNKRTVWEVPLSKFRDTHFAVFPEKLIQPCILAGSPEKGLVLDPFCGSGTAGNVALGLKRQFVGIDISERYCEMARDRILRQDL